jgi:hypothetical protein
MPTLPWTTTDEHDGDVVVLASRLRLRKLRDVPSFLREALAIRRQVLRSRGALGVSLLAQPRRKTFWTLSAWTDDRAIEQFVVAEPHQTTMKKYHERLADAHFVTWVTNAAILPRPRTNARELWNEGKHRLATAVPADR